MSLYICTVLLIEIILTFFQVKGPSRKLQAENAQGRKANQSNLAEKAGGESCKSESSKRQKLDTRHKADGPDSVWFPF